MFNSLKKRSEKGSKIIVVGCGKVGQALVEMLVKEKHDVTIIDKAQEVVEHMTGLYDVIGMTGNGASYTVLEEAGITNADLLIAVTDSDELNLLCCVLARQAGQCQTIARVRSPEYSEDLAYLKSRLEMAMIINPDYETAREISHILFLPQAISVSSFARGQAEVVRIKIPEGNTLHGKKIRQLGPILAGGVLICAIDRNGEVFIPDGNTELMEGDILSFVTPTRAAKTFLKKIGLHSGQVKETMIVGGGRTGFYLARRLLHNGLKVRIIEKDKNRCEELSELLPDAVIINGDGTDEDLLKEAGIKTVDAFVPMTGIDEENILLSLHAKEVSETGAKLVTKINRMMLNSAVEKLDLGSVVHPKYITAEAIIAYVRARNASDNSNIETLVHLYKDKVEAIEFIVGQEDRLTEIPLHMLELKDHLLLACISREGRVLIPGGNDVIKAGDSVIVVTTHSGLREVQDILK